MFTNVYGDTNSLIRLKVFRAMARPRSPRPAGCGAPPVFCPPRGPHPQEVR